MTQRNIEIMDIIVDKMAAGKKLSENHICSDER